MRHHGRQAIRATLMKIYRSLKQVPELAALSRSDRRLIFNKCLRRYPGWKKHTWILLFCGLIGHVASEFIGEQMRSRSMNAWPGASPDIVEFIVFLMGCTVGSVIIRHVIIRRMRPRFREFIPVGSEKPAD